MNLFEAILILGFLCIFTTLIVQKWTSSKLIVTVISAILGAMAFQVAANMNLGFLDPFFQTAVVISLAPAIVISFFTVLSIRNLSSK
jgi:Na+/H+ antiporter NhaB